MQDISMSPVAVFFRTLLRTSAIFIGAAAVFLHPSLEWRADTSTSVVAHQAPREEAIDALIEAVHDANAGVRVQAAVALGRLESSRALPALAAALRDGQPAVRRAAAEALAAIDRPHRH